MKLPEPATTIEVPDDAAAGFVRVSPATFTDEGVVIKRGVPTATASWAFGPDGAVAQALNSTVSQMPDADGSRNVLM